MKRMWRGVLSCAVALLCTAAGAGTVTYYHNDLAGSPVVATNASGQVIWRESYRPYGERLTNAPASSGNAIWFTSRRQDAETGLVYMGARYYDPVIGRFLSKDPVGFDEKSLHSHNRYAYANNNPYKFKDPDGRAADFVWDLASFALSVAMFKQDPTLANFAGAAVDGLALAVPFVPGGVGAIRTIGSGAETAASVARTVPDDAVIVRGGTKDLPPPGEAFSGAAGRTLEEAAQGVPHGQIRATTAGQIRAGGGTVEHAPELTRSGAMNEKHVNICQGPGPCAFGPVQPNPVPKADRVQ